MATELHYHGSFDVIDEFWPLTHFGTRDAAIGTLRSKNAMKNLGKQTGYLYRAELVFGGPVGRLTQDHGTPRPIGYLLMLMGMPSAPHFDYAAFQQHNAALAQIYGTGPHRPFRGDHPNDLQARNYVANVIAGLSYGGLDYVNGVEDAGSVSYVVLGNAQVRIFNHEVVTL